ncbi:MAG: DUF4271 domain-containing protein [Bacteroidetes bacterium]|nr:DUF4271 domain-containing protein [Bacteroidota bacterium]
MFNRLSYIFILLLFTLLCSGQVEDSLNRVKEIDSMIEASRINDSVEFIKYRTLIDYQAPLNTIEGKITRSDIQQMLSNGNNSIVFIILLTLLILITYTKIFFGNEIIDLVQSIVNRSATMQSLRTQVSELSIASLILHVNFVFALSLYVRFVLVHYYSISSLENFSSILFLSFLFTLFYVAKIVTMKLLGNILELTNECNEYIFYFTTTCKTLGLVLIPALFIFYTAEKYFFDFIFIASIIICVAFVLLFIWRGLSTSTKLLYRSVYHFFIYVWVIEVLPIFLLFKLLTKTVT